MSAPLDRNALRIDVEQSKGAWDEMAKLMRAVTSYTSALDSLDLDGVDVFQTRVDLFWNLPELRGTLVTARSHGQGWRSIGQGLFNSVILQMSMFGYSLQGATAQVKGIVDAAAAAKRPITADERRTIVTLLQGLQSSLNGSTAAIARQQPEIVAFLRTITEDSAPLKSGSRDLGKAIDKVQQNATNEALKYAFDPLSRGIYNAVVELGAKILQRLHALQATLDPLARANGQVLESVQGILAIWATIAEKFKAVIDVLVLTETTVDTFSTLPDLMEIATESWQDVASYVLKP